MLPVVLILVLVVLALVLIERSKRAVEPQQPVSQVSAVHCSLLVLLLLPSVASPPTDVMVSRTGLNRVLVSWSAPSSALAGYEVFYQVAGGSTLSGGNTSNTELTLTGLTLGKTYSFFVVGYGAEGKPVLPSAHSNKPSIMIAGEICHCEYNRPKKFSLVSVIPQLPSNPSVTANNTTVVISWILPLQYSPDYYNVSFSCHQMLTLMCITAGSVTVTTTNHTFSNSSLPPGSSCNISVVAVYINAGMSNTVSSTVNIITQGVL